MVRIVTATRFDERRFRRESPLARSMLQLARRPGVTIQVGFLNERALAFTYNPVIATAPSPDDVLLFVHDDVWIEDWFLAERLEEALGRYDVVGVAGNVRREPRQATWWTKNAAGAFDATSQRGSVGHVQDGFEALAYFGPAPDEVKTLDGLFLAARAGTLRKAGVEFDPRFPFDFYDLDFCRSCERAGLRMGVWPIAVTHESMGDYRTPRWQAAYEAYLAKWGE